MDFEFKKSKTSKVITGCGNLYVTVDYNDDNSVHKVRLQRNSKFKCPLTMRESLAKQATFQVRRDKAQLLKDLKGFPHTACDEYSAFVQSMIKKGILASYSCSDAIARVIEHG